MFISQAVSSIVASVFLILGASVLLLSINWKLGIGVLAVLPIIGGTFSAVNRRVRKLFRKSQEAIDWLNKVINESILGSALIRLVNSQDYEYEKFVAANTEARKISLDILRLFAGLIPVIILHQSGDPHDPHARWTFRHYRFNEPRQFHGIQQLTLRF